MDVLGAIAEDVDLGHPPQKQTGGDLVAKWRRGCEEVAAFFEELIEKVVSLNLNVWNSRQVLKPERLISYHAQPCRHPPAFK